MKRSARYLLFFSFFALPHLAAATNALENFNEQEKPNAHAVLNDMYEGLAYVWAPGGCLTAPTDSLPKKAPKTEKVEGFWSVMGYFGTKLTSELGERLNLVESEDDGEPVQVKLKIGSFEMTRNERRK